MSSNYTIFCLGHDPAIEIMGDISSPNDALVMAAERRHERLNEHSGCDLLVGRYSGGLVEIGCPGDPYCHYHGPNADTWTEAGWLRLLYIAHAHDIGVGELRIPSCWTRERVLKLWAALGMERLP